MDQHAAQELVSQTPFGSLELGTDEPYLSDDTTSNGTLYYRTLSFASPTVPLTALGDPKTVFDRMFAGADATMTEEEIVARRELRTSLLDSVLDQTGALEKRLNYDDKIKLDQFTSGVRDRNPPLTPGGAGGAPRAAGVTEASTTGRLPRPRLPEAAGIWPVGARMCTWRQG